MKKVLKNSIYGLLSYALGTILMFYLQKVFIKNLGYQNLGLNSILTTIISTLSIAELGIGTAITFSLYAPLLKNDTLKIAQLIQLYRRIFRILGCIVAVLGLLVIPFLPVITKHEYDLNYILPAYFIVLLNSVISYFFTYNHTLLSANQQNFIVSIVSTVCKVATIITQIIILKFSNNYYLFLSMSLLFGFLSNLLLSIYVKKKYQFINDKNIPKMDSSEIKIIKNNIFALMYHRIGNYLVTGTDNIIISTVLGTTIVGYFSNYLMITNTISNLILSIFIGLTAGFGHFLINKNSKEIYNTFKNVQFVYFVLFLISTTGIFVLINFFLKIWIGDESQLSFSFLIILCFNFFITGYSNALGNIRAAAGIFAPDKYLHIIIAVLNLVVSIILVNIWGIEGVLIGTLICLIIKECIVLPRICAKHIFQERAIVYYKKLIFDMLIAFFTILICYFLYNQINIGNIYLSFFVGFIICISIPLIIIFIFYFKSDEMKYFFNFISKFFHKK